MKVVPSHPKIFTLGQRFSESVEPEAIFEGSVVIQEKVDGSQFSFGVNENGEFVAKSRKRHLNLEEPENLFDLGVEYLRKIEKNITVGFPPDSYFYCEYLRKPKHNTLKYDRVPTNNFVLFAAYIGGEWVTDLEELEMVATILGIDMIPELWRGHGNKNIVEKLLETESYLGGPKIEGVVIKNYGKMLNFYGEEIPIIAKCVAERFKEKHDAAHAHKTENQAPINYAKGFCTEARWEKAVQHLKENGILMEAPQDIGNLIAEIRQDILAEEEKEILNWGGEFVLSLVLKEAIKGLPEWYKGKLMDKLSESDGE